MQSAEWRCDADTRDRIIALAARVSELEAAMEAMQERARAVLAADDPGPSPENRAEG